MEELTERRQAILAMVVREYIGTARPVGSKTIVERYNLNISSATMRNEMAYLEEQGYLTHFHTSSGRVPTEKGYRYFVECLMEEAELPLVEQRMIRHQFHQLHLELDQWMRLAAAVLAHTACSAALVTAPRASRCCFKHLELISIRGPMVLLILILQGGTVKKQIFTLAQPLSQDDLNLTSNWLNDVFKGLDASQVVAQLPRLSPFESQIAELVVKLMERADQDRGSDIYRDGLINILREPEFTEVESVRQLIKVLERGGFLEQVLAEASPVSGVQVIIGGEGRWDELSEYSIVLAPYGVVDRAMGTVGVLGPMRMPYRRAISTVRYIADLLSDLVHELYGY